MNLNNRLSAPRKIGTGDMQVTEIIITAEHPRKFEGTVTVAEGKRSYVCQWTGEYIAPQVWRVTGNGALMASGGRMDPTDYPFVNELEANQEVIELIENALDQHRRDHKTPAPPPDVRPAPFQRPVPTASPPVAKVAPITVAPPAPKAAAAVSSKPTSGPKTEPDLKPEPKPKRSYIRKIDPMNSKPTNPELIAKVIAAACAHANITEAVFKNPDDPAGMSARQWVSFVLKEKAGESKKNIAAGTGIKETNVYPNAKAVAKRIAVKDKETKQAVKAILVAAGLKKGKVGKKSAEKAAAKKTAVVKKTRVPVADKTSAAELTEAAVVKKLIMPVTIYLFFRMGLINAKELAAIYGATVNEIYQAVGLVEFLLAEQTKEVREAFGVVKTKVKVTLI